MTDKKTGKTVSGTTLFIISVVSFALGFFLGGTIGDGLKLLGTICLIMAIIRWNRTLRDRTKHNKPGF